MRSLCVFSGGTPVGTLYDNQAWRFEYDPCWSQRPDAFDLAPCLPRCHPVHDDCNTAGPVQWFFDNLLPEEALRLALAQEAGIDEDDTFALLLGLGAECAGSLSIFPNDGDPPTAHGLVQLPYEKLSSRIVNLPVSTMTAGAPTRVALAGAQHKLPVVYRNGRLYEPLGATPSTHILKPNHPDTDSYPASVVNEYLTMRLARSVGLPVPAVHMLYVPQPAYVVERFDRVANAATLLDAGPPSHSSRRHIVDGCQLLNKPRALKYSGASLQTLFELSAASSHPAETESMLFRWLVFNILVANDDCHLKNLSFFVSPEGVQLAPHYDLLSTSAYHTRAFANEKATWPDVRMIFPLGSANFFGDVTAQLILEAGLKLGLSAARSRRIVEEVSTGVRVALRQELAEIRTFRASAPEAARVHLAAEDRLLRVVEHIIVKEMSERLQS